MDLHSMKRTKAEKKENAGPEVAREHEGPDYPYGLEISLEEECLEKLGLDMDDFSIGGRVDMVCVGEITRTHESAGRDHSNSSASVQITDMILKVQPNEKKQKLKELLTIIKGAA